MAGLIVSIGAGVLLVSCRSERQATGPEVEAGIDGVVETAGGNVGERSELEVILGEWEMKLSDPGLDPVGRRKLLREFGLDDRIPIYDLGLYVTEKLPESDWFGVLFQRLKDEEKTNILECLRLHPLLDRGDFARNHCDRSFGLAAGKQAPLEGIAWCENIQDPQRRKSAAYGLKVSIAGYANEATCEKAGSVLKRILAGSLFEDYEKDQMAFSILRTLHGRGLLDEDARAEVDGLLSEEVSRKLKLLVEKSGS